MWKSLIQLLYKPKDTMAVIYDTGQWKEALLLNFILLPIIILTSAFVLRSWNIARFGEAVPAIYMDGIVSIVKYFFLYSLMCTSIFIFMASSLFIVSSLFKVKHLYKNFFSLYFMLNIYVVIVECILYLAIYYGTWKTESIDNVFFILFFAVLILMLFAAIIGFAYKVISYRQNKSIKVYVLIIYVWIIILGIANLTVRF